MLNYFRILTPNKTRQIAEIIEKGRGQVIPTDYKVVINEMKEIGIDGGWECFLYTSRSVFATPELFCKLYNKGINPDITH